MRIVRRLTHALVIVLTLLVGAAAAAVVVSQTAWFKNWLRGYIVREANQYLNGTLSIERLGGNLLFGVEMENIGVSMDGSQVVAVKDLGLSYSVFELITKGLSVSEIKLDKPVIYLRREGDTWSLSRLVKKQATEADRTGPGKPIAIDNISITDGRVAVDSPVGTSGVDVPKRFEHLDAKLSFKYEPVRYSIEISSISFRASEPALALNALSGGISVHDDAVNIEKLALRTSETSLSIDGAVQNYLTRPILNLQITSDKLSIREIAQLVPALAGVKLQPAFEIKLNGPFDQLGVDMNVRSSAGSAIGRFVAGLETPHQSVKGDLTVHHLDLSQLTNDPAGKSDITANAHVDIGGESLSNVAGLRGRLAIDSPRIVAAGYTAGPIDAKAEIAGRQVALTASAAAYGASATASGRVTLPDFSDESTKTRPIAFDLNGQLRHVDLRQMPKDLKIPPADTNVSADYHVAGTVVTGTKATQTVTGDATLLPSAVAGATIAGGSTVGFSLNGKAVRYSADATVRGLDLQRVGGEFNVPALAASRYKSSINAHIVANGRGTTPKDIDLTAKGSLTDTSIMDATIPRLDFDASMAADTAHIKATGSFAGLDPSIPSGRKEAAGKVGGTLDIDATVAHVSSGVAADSVQADAKMALEPSTVGGLEISRANLDATYHDSSGEIRTLEITGRDLNVQAKGTLALNDNGRSNLTLHADSPSLSTIGSLVNQPIDGIAKLDATITGNKRELQAKGNLTADGLKYGDNGALALSTEYTAKVVDLEASSATVVASSHATFVTLAGQNINELTADTTYDQQKVVFDATAKQPQRSLGLGGELVLHPDHQEVHLKQLGLQTAGQSWQLAAGSQATVNYGQDAVTVEGLTLVNGDQRMSADGTFGQAGDALTVTLSNVDLATVDAILLRPPQLSGRLNGSSTLGGTRDKPEVQADFNVTQGGFREFKYDTFGGTVNYAGPGITVDAKLQQNATTWIQAKGYVPVAALKAAQGGGAASHESAAREDSFDLHVDSSPIDLGLVQGFTTALTHVTGTMQAKIDVTGAADDPHPNGAITLDKGAFTVEPTGVAYSNLQGRIDLQPDKIHIDNMSVLDNHQSALSVSGDLAIHERQVGGVSIYLNASDFKVIDNKTGNVRIDSNLAITGEINAPRVEGELGVTTGQIDLDPILAQIADSAYATQATEYVTKDDAAPPASVFDALQVEVHVTVPNDLVVKASDLTAPGAPIGLGALNLTLGGDLWASKVPWDQLRLVGTVNTVRGNYDFQGRRFEILRDGTVRFEGTDDLDPALDIRTQRIIQAVTANVNVRGTLKRPDIVLSSTPPLEQADILSLIVFNQQLNALGEGQQVSLMQRAQSMATGAVASELAKSIGNALNLDTFEIDVAPESGGGPQFTVGQQLGQNLYVKVQQGVGDVSQTNLILEYELTKWMRLRTNILQGAGSQPQLFQRTQGSGADLLFFFSY